MITRRVRLKQPVMWPIACWVCCALTQKNMVASQILVQLAPKITRCSVQRLGQIALDVYPMVRSMRSRSANVPDVFVRAVAPNTPAAPDTPKRFSLALKQ